MLFSSNIFIFFFLPFVLLVYYTILRGSRDLRNLFLFLASLFFYAWGEPRFVLVMMGSIVLNWLIGLLIYKTRQGDESKSKTKTKALLIIAIICNLSIIFVFKYLMFTLENIKFIFGIDSITIPVIKLPIGISFFTFQAMSYVIDVYRRDGRVQKNLINVGLYIAFFPQLIAGPIVRYNTIDKQINDRTESFDMFSDGVIRFIIGLSKKVIIANSMAVVADYAFGVETEMSVLLAWLGAIAYTFQIYFDFSGYSDMAIGLGKMFGFEFLENFNYPYISKSITEFWRRWHMSLGTWFRDYLYIPLGGNRVSKGRHVFNLFIVWLCTGIWHGANWTFVTWGLMYFVLLTFEKYSSFDTSEDRGKYDIPKHVYTMLLVILGWVVFRAESLGIAGAYIKAMAGAGVPLVNDGFLEYFRQIAVFIVIAIIGSTPWPKNVAGRIVGNRAGSAVGFVYLAIILLVAVSMIVKDTYNPFIYFNF